MRADQFLVGFGPSPGLWLLTASVVGLSLMLGGGTRQGLWSDAVVQLSALLLLAVLIPSGFRAVPASERRWVLFLVTAIALLPLLQLLPLPPTLWTRLPGRAAIVAGFSESNIELPWLPVSLDPAATWRSFLSLLPPIAVFFATLRLGPRARRSLSLVLIVFGVVSVLLGLAQLMQGSESPLRFFPITNPGSSVGFFANRNHYAALLYCLIPLTAAWMIGLLFDRRPERIFGLAVCLLVYAALILGLGMALSRAGIFLAMVAAVACLLFAGAYEPRIAKRGLAVMAGAILVGAVLVVQFALFDLIGRFEDDPLADNRFDIAATTIEAARAFQPVGAGFGTFVPVYQMFETVRTLWTSYVNHAHNDWLEIWLEGGWPAVAILLAFLGWFGFASAKVWRAPPDHGRALDRALPQAASIVVLLLLLHSVVDYPLRTTAMMTLFAYCCGLLLSPARLPQRVEVPSGRSRRGERRNPGPSTSRPPRRAAGWQTGRSR